MDINDKNGFINFINTLELQQLRTCQSLINEVILDKLSLNNSIKCNLSRNHDLSCQKDVNEYLDYHVDFIDENEKKELEKELESLHFNTKPTNSAVQNKFISSANKPYVWESPRGQVVNDALVLDNYPVIKTIMGRINSNFNANMNCALVSYYKCGTVNVRKHDDNESSLDQTEPICVLSLGANRRVEFFDKVNDSYQSVPVKKLTSKDKSLYIMKPGCQNHFKHRVPLDRRVKHSRISISFRCFSPQEQCVTSNTVSTPLHKSVISSSSISALIKHGPESVSPISTNEANKSLSTHAPRNFSKQLSNSPPYGKIPFREHDRSIRTNTTWQSNKPEAGEKVCLILGTSITNAINGKKMSRGSRTVVNWSLSGARIQDIKKLAEDFYIENAHTVNSVDKIIISVGTNEVKWFNSKKYDIAKKFRTPLVNLVKCIKYMFPHAILHFQSVLPIRLFYNYTAKSVNQFNDLLYDLCKDYGCIYLDCFNDFLDINHYDYDRNLFRDSCHLNNLGLSRLCRAFKYIIYQSSFNPRVRYEHFLHYKHNR